MRPSLDVRLQNERKNYLKIVEELGSRDATVLQRWYTALTQCVALISPRDMRDLVQQIFSFSFCTEMPTLHAYMHFLMFLLSANTDFLLPTLKVLVSNLTYRPGAYLGVCIPF